LLDEELKDNEKSTKTETNNTDNHNTNKRKRSMERGRRSLTPNISRAKDTNTSSPEKKIKLEEVNKFINKINNIFINFK